MTYAVILDNQVKTPALIRQFLNNEITNCPINFPKDTSIFAGSELEKFVEKEQLHDNKILTQNTKQALKTMSSGEQKKLLLKHILKSKPKALLVVNPYDNLDQNTQLTLQPQLTELSTTIPVLQLLTRRSDALPNTSCFYELIENSLHEIGTLNASDRITKTYNLTETLPQPLIPITFDNTTLIDFKNVSVQYGEQKVLQHINWTINKNEFWQLKGPNGSGKSTLLNMITGDSHKAYGQDVTIFGHKKGSGESVWDLKKMIGYFSPAMVDRFKGYHSVLHMIIAGLYDAVGLYNKPSEIEKNLALQWLQLLQLTHKKNSYFNTLSVGEKRLVMTARAMIKHPPLLILDEPTVGLDDDAAAFFVALVNTFANNSNTTILYVSHRNEPGLAAEKHFELTPTTHGSIGTVH